MKRIVISGTYCTGKTTFSLALSALTGIPVTHARTMRELLPVMYPGKELRSCDYSELLCLGMRRFSERIATEGHLGGSFISDGCPLQEWIYGTTRLLTGAYPDETAAEFALRQRSGGMSPEVFEQQLRAFGELAKNYTQNHYDIFFHLPVEFPFVADGHRPTSEAFRQRSEALLQQTYADTDISPYVLGGSIEKRLEQALDVLRLQACRSVADAVRIAEATRREKFDSIGLERPKLRTSLL